MWYIERKHFGAYKGPEFACYHPNNCGNWFGENEPINLPENLNYNNNCDWYVSQALQDLNARITAIEEKQKK